MKEYIIRPHHGMCLAFFSGKGYSEEFVKNMTEIKSQLAKNPLVCITGEADMLCAFCPNNKDGICTSEEKVREYDRQVLEKCGLSVGDVLPFLDFEKLVQENILLCGKRKEICGNCEWNELCG
ncbi:MAG: DUF1284 domain-containing protein [Eubacterium sp.]|nr:DUF1284 domain-containing protein [Eubacterium sp.]